MNIDEFVKYWREKYNTEDAVYAAYHYDAMEGYAKYKTEQLEAENTELREYTTHRIACDSNITFGENCTCGLTKVLEE